MPSDNEPLVLNAQGEPFATEAPPRGRNGNSANGSSKPSSSKSASNQPMGMAVLIGIPWLMFSMISVLFAFAFHHWPLLVLIIIFVWTVLALVFIALNAKGQPRMGGSWYLFLGVLCLLAILNSTVCGAYNYWLHMFQYWSYDENAVYTNVLPTEPAAGHADAGKIVFSSTARVDTSRAIGYKVGSVYCVAPILDDTQLDKVEYWAAGIDCCDARGDFDCDDTWNPQARSGVVILNTAHGDTSVSQTGKGKRKAGFHFFKSPWDYYIKAVREAEGNFAVTSAEHPLFVRWVADPQQIQDDYWRSGVGTLVATVCIYLLVSLVAGVACQMFSKRSAAAQGAQGI